MSVIKRVSAKLRTEGAVSLRIRPDDRALIDRAARVAGTSRTEFMLAASRRAAQEAILDQSLFLATAEEFRQVEALLDAPPTERFRRLMATKPPWG